jgi:hypothetical protein
MARTANLPKAEIKIQVRDSGNDTWRDLIDTDPVRVSVEQYAVGSSGLLVDVFDPAAMGVVETVIELDNAPIERPSDWTREYNLVWSDSGFSVKGCCPVCDDVYSIAEGAVGDELNEGVNALVCPDCIA